MSERAAVVLASYRKLLIGHVGQRASDAQRTMHDSLRFRVVGVATEEDYDACILRHGGDLDDPPFFDPVNFYFVEMD